MKRVAQVVVHVAKLAVAFGFFWLGGAWLSYVRIPWLCAQERGPARREARARLATQRGFAFFLRFLRRLGLMEVDPGDARRRPLDGPFVLVANHPTLVDVVFLMATYPDVCCVAKGMMYRSPFVGRLLRLGGHLDGGRGGVESVVKVIEAGCERIRRGTSVLVFPEGTRSPPGDIHPFQRGAFEIAGRTGAPVLPTVLSCTPPALMKGAPWYAVPRERVRLSLEELTPRRVGESRSEVRAARDELERIVRARVLDPLGRGAQAEGDPALLAETHRRWAGSTERL